MSDNKQYFIRDVETDELREVSKERFDEYLMLIGKFFKVESSRRNRDPLYDLFKSNS